MHGHDVRGTACDRTLPSDSAEGREQLTLLENASRADVPRKPVGRADTLHAHHSGRGGGVDEFLTADREPYVRGAGCHRREEHEITRAYLVELNLFTDLELFRCRTRRRNVVLSEDVL